MYVYLEQPIDGFPDDSVQIRLQRVEAEVALQIVGALPADSGIVPPLSERSEYCSQYARAGGNNPRPICTLLFETIDKGTEGAIISLRCPTAESNDTTAGESSVQKACLHLAKFLTRAINDTL